MNKRITVWHMNGVMNAGGTESLIMNVFKYRSNRINHVLVVHSINGNQQGIYDNEIKKIGIKMLYLPSVGSVGIKEYTKKLCELVDKEGEPDIVHSHLNAVGGVIARAAKKAGIEHRVIHCHANIKYKGTKIDILISELKLAFMKLMVNKYGTEYFACSKTAARRLFYRPSQAVIIKNAISVKKYFCDDEKYRVQRRKLQIDNQTILIGSVGRIARIKNYEIIINAIFELLKKGKNVKYICYGRVDDKQYFEELKILCSDYKIEDYIIFKGNSMEIFNDIAAFDVFVMPSWTEGLGISALEAQAAGKRCLLSQGVPKDADIGLGLVTYIEPSDVSAWIYEILNTKKIVLSQDDIEGAFNKKGYNAPLEVKKIEDEYIKIMRY